VEWQTVRGRTRLLGWYFCSCLFRLPFGHGIDTEMGYTMATTIQENSIRYSTTTSASQVGRARWLARKRGQFFRGSRLRPP
jgi:hypothetical protein